MAQAHKMYGFNARSILVRNVSNLGSVLTLGRDLSHG